MLVNHEAKYDLASNVVSASDPVDGDAERLHEEPESNNSTWVSVEQTHSTELQSGNPNQMVDGLPHSLPPLSSAYLAAEYFVPLPVPETVT